MTALDSRSLQWGAGLLLAASLVRFGVEKASPRISALPEGTDRLGALEAESQEALDEKRLREKPLAPGELLDPNRAGEAQLDRLPGIGPSIARAVVEERTRGGGFSGPHDLLRVRGIGERTLDRIGVLLDFTGGIPVGLGRDRSVPLRSVGPRIDLNVATLEELTSLPGIGPGLAGRIIQSRKDEGPFRVPEDLLRVRGIGPRVLEKILARIRPGK
jgi:competence protein ComEA